MPFLTGSRERRQGVEAPVHQNRDPRVHKARGLGREVGPSPRPPCWLTCWALVFLSGCNQEAHCWGPGPSEAAGWDPSPSHVTESGPPTDHGWALPKRPFPGAPQSAAFPRACHLLSLGAPSAGKEIRVSGGRQPPLGHTACYAAEPQLKPAAPPPPRAARGCPPLLAGFLLLPSCPLTSCSRLSSSFFFS